MPRGLKQGERNEHPFNAKIIEQLPEDDWAGARANISPGDFLKHPWPLPSAQVKVETLKKKLGINFKSSLADIQMMSPPPRTFQNFTKCRKAEGSFCINHNKEVLNICKMPFSEFFFKTVSHYNPRWLWTCGNPLVSASRVMGLQAFATT